MSKFTAAEAVILLEQLKAGESNIRPQLISFIEAAIESLEPMKWPEAVAIAQRHGPIRVDDWAIKAILEAANRHPPAARELPDDWMIKVHEGRPTPDSHGSLLEKLRAGGVMSAKPAKFDPDMALGLSERLRARHKSQPGYQGHGKADTDLSAADQLEAAYNLFTSLSKPFNLPPMLLESQDAFSARDRTLRELQTSLPWTGHYHRDFRSTPMTHKDFGHALL